MSSPTSKRLLCVLGAALLWIANAAAAQPATKDAEAASNEPCLKCHGDKSAKAQDSGRLIGIDPGVMAASIHGKRKVNCVDCHTDVAADAKEHPPMLKPASCVACHEDEVKEYQGTIHGMAKAKGNGVAASCADCHGTHDILRSKDAASRTNFANIEATCGTCHGNDAVIEKGHIPGGNIRNQYHDSVHGQKTNAQGKSSQAPTCTSCHGAHNILTKKDPRSKVSKQQILDTCASCHQRQRAVFATSLHGKLRQKGRFSAPSCVDCHTPHRIQMHNATAFQVAVINECGHCHTEQIATYRDTFHGQVTQLGYTRVATCASCHGSHQILPASNVESMVSPENRLKTCQQCHKDANANFAMYSPHGNAHDRDQYPLLFFTKKAMDWLLIGVFAFFGIHTLLWFVRSLRELRSRRAERPSN